MNTNIKRKMTEALEKIAFENGKHSGWLVCYHAVYKDISFSIYKINDRDEEEKRFTIKGVDFFIYNGTKKSDILPIAHKIIKEIEEVEL